ncbi:MAG: dephospho-CoA kinase [Lentimicrobium sp.]|jgi:dephospho-CoA kinase|nr:dephospho-CoA kinase [Lentimicrobium sp.]
MLKIGLTGSIGSGKSTVASVFRTLGVPVYIADIEAKKFLEEPDVIDLIVALAGKKVLSPDGSIDRKVLAKQVFGNPEKLEGLNAIIHPRVRKNFTKWVEQNEAHPYVIQESAIIFESGFYTLFDLIIVVAAPEEERIQRVLRRDGFKREEVISRIENQWPEYLKIEKADFVIHNCDTDIALPQVLKIHDELLNISKSRSALKWKN